MNFLQTQEWGLMILDGKPSKDLVFVIKKNMCAPYLWRIFRFSLFRGSYNPSQTV